MQIKNQYGFYQKVQLTLWLLRTKMIYPKVRIFRFPLDLRGKRYIDFGKNLTTGVGCRLEAFSQDGSKTLHFGADVQINDYVHICAMENVTIGNNVLMAGKVYISDNSHGSYKGDEYDSSPEIAPTQRAYPTKAVVIEDNVWIGEGVVVLPGVRIGRGAIIGANAVVSKSIEEYTIAVGQPARAVKKYDLLKQRWEPI